MIYKIFRSPEWEELQRNGHSAGAPIDVADGFVHFSTAGQLAGTLGKHFAGVSGLWLAALDEAGLSESLKWEVSRGGALFPHLYRRLALADILWCREIPMTEAGHLLPDDLA